MRAVAFRVGQQLRTRRWRPAAVAVAVALGVALVVSVVAGARRTASAPARYVDRYMSGLDVGVVQPSGRVPADAVLALPEVAQLGWMTFVSARPVPEPRGPDVEIDTFAGTRLDAGDRVLVGRMPNASSPYEFVANGVFMRQFGLAVGDRLEFHALSQDQMDRGAYDEAPNGAAFDATVVGRSGGISELEDPTSKAMFSAALLDEDVGTAASLLFVGLAEGASADDMIAAARALPHGDELAVEYDEAISRSLVDSVAALANALWLVALVTGAAIVVALGIVLSRYVGARNVDRQTLRALGYRRAQRVAEQALHAAVLLVAGGALAVGLAVLVSGFFPVGFARKSEPAPGLRVDLVALIVGTALIGSLTLLWVAASSVLALGPARSSNPSSAAELAARSGLGPAASIGVRFAFTRGGGGPTALTTMATLGVAIAGVVATGVFGASMSRLVSDGDRFGANFDQVIGSTFSEAPDDLSSAMADQEALEGVMLLSTTTLDVDGEIVNIIGVEPVRGGLTPRILAGRFPADTTEIALGRLTADALGVGIGDDLRLEGSTGSQTYRVVGYAVIPAVGFGRGVGHGATMLERGLDDLEPEREARAAAVRLAPGTTSEQLLAIAEGVGSFPDDPDMPTDVRNVERTRYVPSLLALVLSIVAGLTFSYRLWSSVRARQRDVAVLRALGAGQRWVARAIHGQALALTVPALVVGVPIGVALGRVLFRAFGERIGAVADPAMPVGLVVAVVVGGLVLATVAALVPAARARRVPVTVALRDE